MIGQCNICIGMSIRCDVEVPKLWYKHNPNDVANADEVTILKVLFKPNREQKN